MKHLENILSCIEDRKFLSLSLRDKTKLKFILPKRVAYLGGGLSLIFENRESRELDSVKVNQIIKINNLKKGEKPLFYDTEVDSYFLFKRKNSIREIRVLLEVEKLSDIDEGQFQMFRNILSYESSNQKFVWAAYVEVGQSFLSWLEMTHKKSKIKVLGPACLQNLDHKLDKSA